MWQKTCCCCSHSLTQVLLTSCSHLVFKKKEEKKKKKVAQPALFTLAFTFALSVCSLIQSHSWPTNNPSPSHSLAKRYILDRFIHEKGRKRQHPPSNTVNEEWSCVLWWQSIYTWEEGYWYWDRSNIAANEALLPGKWEKRWWTVEEIYEGLTINSKQKNANNSTQYNSNEIHNKASLSTVHEHWNAMKYQVLTKIINENKLNFLCSVHTTYNLTQSIL